MTELERLRSRVAELEDELAEWKRQARDDDERGDIEARLLALQRALKLTSAQARGLSVLMRSRGRVVSRERLWRAITVSDETDMRLLLNSRICTLRQQLPKGAIETMRGTGYMLQPKAAAWVDARLAKHAS